MKAVVAAFNQEKALVGAFSVITNLWMELFQALEVILRLPILREPLLTIFFRLLTINFWLYSYYRFLFVKRIFADQVFKHSRRCWRRTAWRCLWTRWSTTESATPPWASPTWRTLTTAPGTHAFNCLSNLDRWIYIFGLHFPSHKIYLQCTVLDISYFLSFIESQWLNKH